MYTDFGSATPHTAPNFLMALPHSRAQIGNYHLALDWTLQVKPYKLKATSNNQIFTYTRKHQNLVQQLEALIKVGLSV